MILQELLALNEGPEEQAKKQAQSYISWVMTGKKGTPSDMNSVTAKDIEKFFDEKGKEVDVKAVLKAYYQAMKRPASLGVSISGFPKDD